MGKGIPFHCLGRMGQLPVPWGLIWGHRSLPQDQRCQHQGLCVLETSSTLP